MTKREPLPPKPTPTRDTRLSATKEQMMRLFDDIMKKPATHTAPETLQ